TRARRAGIPGSHVFGELALERGRLLADGGVEPTTAEHARRSLDFLLTESAAGGIGDARQRLGADRGSAMKCECCRHQSPHVIVQSQRRPDYRHLAIMSILSSL